MQFFRTHPNNIADIRAAVRVFGAIMFHADGNIFAQDKKGTWLYSDNQQKYTNEANKAAKYRIMFNAQSIMPKTKEHLDKMLIDAYNQELSVKATVASQGTGRVQSFTATQDDFFEPDADINFEEIDREKLASTNKSKTKK